MLKKYLLIILTSAFCLLPARVAEGFEAGADSSALPVSSADTLSRPGRVLSRDDILHANFENTARAFLALPSFFYQDLGSPGAFSGLSYRGGKPEELRMSIGDIPLHNHYTGMADINTIPFSMIQTIETVSSDGIAGSPSQNPAHLTFNTPDLLESVPRTDILYRIGDYERSSVDVGFRRKIASHTGIGIFTGFQSFPGEYGEKEFNGKHIGAGVSTAFRNDWLITGWLLVWKRGMNAPVDLQLSGVNPLNWLDRLNSDRKLYAFNLSRDYAHTSLNVSVYGSRYEQRYQSSLNASPWYQSDDYDGARFSFKRRFGKTSFFSTMDVYAYRAGDKRNLHYDGVVSETSIGIVYSPALRHKLTVWGGGSADHGDGRLFTGGARYTYRIREYFGIYGDGGRYGRLPSVRESLDCEGKTFRENSYSMGLYVDGNSAYTGTLSFYGRDRIYDYVSYFDPFDEYAERISGGSTYFGISHESRLRLGAHVRLTCGVSGESDPDNFLSIRYTPHYFGNAGIQFIDLNKLFLPYRISTFTGVNVRIFGRRNSLIYYPVWNSFSAYGRYETASGRIIDVKGMLTVKSFSVFYEVDNILGETYEPVIGYPFPKQTIRIGVRWSYLN